MHFISWYFNHGIKFSKFKRALMLLCVVPSMCVHLLTFLWLSEKPALIWRTIIPTTCMFPNASTSPSSLWWGQVGFISSSSKWTIEKIINLGLSRRFFNKLNVCCLLETWGSHWLNSCSSYVWNIIIYCNHFCNYLLVLLLPVLSILTSFTFFQCFSL